MEKEKQIVDRIKDLSNEDLLKMLQQDLSNYTTFALEAASQELSARGGKEAVIKKIEKEKEKENQLQIEREKKERERPKVPVSCKVIGLVCIVLSFGLILRNYDAYTHYWWIAKLRLDMPAKIVQIAFDFGLPVLIALSAGAMIYGNKIGLAVLSFILLMYVIVPLAFSIQSGTGVRESFSIVSLVCLLLSFYLFFNWKHFTRIAEYRSRQNRAKE